MLSSMARKVASMQRAAHDNAMRQEGAAAAFAAAAKRLEAMEGEAGANDGERYAQRVQALLANMQQAAHNQMAQQAGRALQAGDILEACKAMSTAEEAGNA